MRAQKIEWEYSFCPQFDSEYFHYEENRKLYPGVSPDHVNQLWTLAVRVNGRRFHSSHKRLQAAADERRRVRMMAGVE